MLRFAKQKASADSVSKLRYDEMKFLLMFLALVRIAVCGRAEATLSVVPLYSCYDTSPFRLQCDHPSMTDYCGGRGNCCFDDGSMQIVDNLHCGADVCTCIHSDACNGFGVVTSTVTVWG